MCVIFCVGAVLGVGMVWGWVSVSLVLGGGAGLFSLSIWWRGNAQGCGF